MEEAPRRVAQAAARPRTNRGIHDISMRAAKLRKQKGEGRRRIGYLVGEARFQVTRGKKY